MLLNMVMFKVTICDFGKMNIKSSGKKYSIKVTYDENKLDKQIYKIANKINKKSKIIYFIILTLFENGHCYSGSINTDIIISCHILCHIGNILCSGGPEGFWFDVSNILRVRQQKFGDE